MSGALLAVAMVLVPGLVLTSVLRVPAGAVWWPVVVGLGAAVDIVVVTALLAADAYSPGVAVGAITAVCLAAAITRCGLHLRAREADMVRLHDEPPRNRT